MRAIEAAGAAMGQSERGVVGKTTKITIETESLLVVHKGKSIVTWCPACDAEVEAMAVEGDSLWEGMPSAFLREWLATGKIHFWSIEGGPVQICLPSLLQCFA